jgi:hypothetical protein
MTIFEDGPAKGKTLMLRRAPFLLRVVECRGKFDALDQETDEPAADEKIYVYELTALPGGMHIRASRGCSGFYTTANYKLCVDQPPEATIRGRADWVKWCDSNQAAVARCNAMKEK